MNFLELFERTPKCIWLKLPLKAKAPPNFTFKKMLFFPDNLKVPMVCVYTTIYSLLWCQHRSYIVRFSSSSSTSLFCIWYEESLTLPRRWCSLKADIRSCAHFIFSGLGENCSWTTAIWLGWITCLPTKKMNNSIVKH